MEAGWGGRNLLQKKEAFTEGLWGKQGPELMDGSGQGSRVIKRTLKESQELLNFNLRARANSLAAPEQGEVHSYWNRRELWRSFQQGQDVTLLEEGVALAEGRRGVWE